MPRKGENIYRRKDGRWEGRYIKSHTTNKKIIYGYVYAKSYKTVKEKLLSAKQQAAINDLPDTFSNEPSFGSVSEQWILYKKQDIKESTYVKYDALLKLYIQPVLSEHAISSISAQFIEDFCNQLIHTGGEKNTGLSPKTVSDILFVVRAVIKYANKLGIQTKTDGKEITVKQTPKQLIVFTMQEQERLVTYLSQNISNRNLGILISLYSGLRIGEICALKWKDILLDEKVIQVTRTMQRIRDNDNSKNKTKIIVTTPKSPCSIRIVPIVDMLYSSICKFYNENCLDDYILADSALKIIEPRTMQNHLKKVLKECQIRPANYHILRHTFATRCIEVGFDVKTLSEILGHSNINITLNRYVHPSLDHKRENMKKLSDLFAVKENGQK